MHIAMNLFFFFLRFYLFILRESGREGERKRNIRVCEKYWSVASHTYPNRGLGPQPGIKPMTFCSAGWCPTKWASPVRVKPFLFPKVLFIYLFLERGKGAGKKRGRETSVCGCLLHSSQWGPGPQPRLVPWLGMEPATLWFAACTQSTEPHQPGLYHFKNIFWD